MAERDKNRSCSPPVPGPSGSTTLTTELVRREETVTKEARETHQATYILK